MIGLLTVDYDDESAAQMLYLKSKIDKLTTNTIIDNISEMWLTYRANVSSFDGWKSCAPTMRFFDTEVTCLISQYPKEWLVNEISSDVLLKYDLSDIRIFEPWWKLILGNKAILPLLWSMFPNHPNLLPAFYDYPT